MWQPQTVVLFDIRVVDTDSPSYVNPPVEAVLSSAEAEKKVKYSKVAEAH